MTADQLKAARAAHWRQNQNPILTLEDAQSWFEQHPLSLFLPRQVQLPAPAPSFVEACRGEASATPPHAAIEQARELLVRLIASGKVVALNLFGSLGEQPDFLAQAEILPFVISLRGERDWKQAPEKSGGHKVSPLVLELWKVLEREGPLTTVGAREKLGRELTEAAVLRALNELWQSLRVIPVLQAADQPAQWELLQTHHRAGLTTGSTTSQVTAISLLVSMYLQSVYAATSEEIELFLSPLVSRSRVREAVRGLSATRQIHSLSMEAQTYYFLEGGLPEFAPEAEPERTEPLRRRRLEAGGIREKFPPGLPRSTPARIPPPIAAQDAAPRPPQFRASAPEPRGARRDEPRGARRDARLSPARPRTGEKQRWPRKEGARSNASPAFGARSGAPRSGAGARPGPRGDGPRKAAGPGGTKERWRKFPQRPETKDRPENTAARQGPASGTPYSGKPYQRDGQRKGERKSPGAQDRRPGGQGYDRPKRTAFPSRFPAKSGGPRTDRPARPFSAPGGSPASRRPRTGSSAGPRTGSGGGAPTQSRFPSRFPAKSGAPVTDRPRRPFSAPGGSPSSRRPSTGPSAGSRASSRTGPRPGPRPGPGGGAPIQSPGRAPGSRPGGYKAGSSGAGSRRPGGPKPGRFKARDSGSRPSRPKFSKSGGSPQSGKGSGKRSFRDRNLGKKKPEA